MFMLYLPQFLYKSKIVSEQIIDKPELPQTIDFVLVYFSSVASIEENYNKIEVFLLNLERQGLRLGSETFSLNNDVNFIKIHATRNVLQYFADYYNINLNLSRRGYRIHLPKPFKCMATELTWPDKNSRIYQRARETFSGETPDDFTTSERALIIYTILSNTAYGNKHTAYGIEKLLDLGVFDAAFPLHDGGFEWTDEGALNDRQILNRFWANIKCIHKEQPLNLIEKYLGTEFGFYFAWLGFYNRFLIITSIIGVIFFILGIIESLYRYSDLSEEICKSKLLICPTCHWKGCKFESLSSSCVSSKLSHIFDNWFTVCFSIIMMIFTRISWKLWRRYEFWLQFRWNLIDLSTNISPRPEFERLSKYRRLSPISGMLESYTPIRVQCMRLTITYSIILLIIILMAISLFGIIVYTKVVSYVIIRNAQKNVLKKSIPLIGSALGTCVSVALIIIFEPLYRRIAFWLTNVENPRTQADYDNSFIFKSYALAFVNNYTVISYIAFVKSHLFTYPGDPNLETTFGMIRSDICDPYGGCMINLGMQLIIIMAVKNGFFVLKQFLMPYLIIYYNKSKHPERFGGNNRNLAQWECDYLLNINDRYHLLQEFIEMVIQYGFVTFYIAAFPLAPLLALINNIFELRVDAYKLIRTYRRRVPLQIADLGAWNDILKAISYISIITNALIIAFTSRFVDREYYIYYNSNFNGYIDFILSAFDIGDLPNESFTNTTKICYYPGMRYPPDHSKRYHLTDDYWCLFTAKLIFVTVYEHSVLILTAIVISMIPNMPTILNDSEDRRNELN